MMIDGVMIVPLKCFSDERGAVMHMLRCDAPFFKRFGEVYFSYCNPGVIKGWKKHKEMTQHFAVPVGNIKLVLYDPRSESATAGEIQEIELGMENYQLVRIPPNVIYSFSAIGQDQAMVVNCADLPHNPEESVAYALMDASIPYKWEVSHK